MSTDISIRVPKEMATPAEFAEWEGISRGSVYQKIHHGQLAKYMVKKEKQRSCKPALSDVQNRSGRESLGHSNFRVIVGK